MPSLGKTPDAIAELREKGVTDSANVPRRALCRPVRDDRGLADLVSEEALGDKALLRVVHVDLARQKLLARLATRAVAVGRCPWRLAGS